MFTRIAPETGETVTIVFEGREITVNNGHNVAAALLAAGIAHFRNTPVSAAPRGPFCMMGVCFDCLLIIDGIANQQACMTLVADGMQISRQSGEADILTEPGKDFR